MPSRICLFVSDLHGHRDRYEKLFHAILTESPRAVFLGGDLLPSGLCQLSTLAGVYENFLHEVMIPGFERLQDHLGNRYPQVFIILGNDDGRCEESLLVEMADEGLWTYSHHERAALDEFWVYGYSYIPPTPFAIKDWERYDVSRYVEPGCTPPEDGYHTVDIDEDEVRWATIKEDLDTWTSGDDLERALFLFHSPPYQGNLDRAALDGRMHNHAPIDVHVGSIAMQRFIQSRQPYITLHGHIHESAKITGSWQDRIGRTYCFSAAHDGDELALVRFDLGHPDRAERELL